MIPPPPEALEGTGAPTSVQELVVGLPLDRKVAQLFLVGFEGDDRRAPILDTLGRTDYGGVVIGKRNYASPGKLASLAGEISATAKKAAHVAPLIMTLQEGGRYSSFPDLPPADLPAKAQTPRKARAQALASGKALTGVGVNGVLGPVVDVGGIGSPIGPRAYSDDPVAVSEFARAAVEGYERAGLLSAPAHFPGIGGVNQLPADGPASVGLGAAELARRDLLPFVSAIDAGAPAILVGNASYVTDDFVRPAAQSPGVIGGLLRRHLGFQGLAIADDLSQGAIISLGSIPDAAVASVKAGADMVYIDGPQGEQEAAFLALLNAARRKEISEARLDQAVLRVLTAKERAGLIQ
jgi:beta-N-acetylhexosaminidase